MKSESDRKSTPPERSTPGRPHESSRQQKHRDQQLESGSDTLDRNSGREGSGKTPTPPGAK
jgi:hypothetical protein